MKWSRLQYEAMWHGVATAIIHDGNITNDEVELLVSMLRLYTPPKNQQLQGLRILLNDVIADKLVTSKERDMILAYLQGYVDKLTPNEKGSEFEKYVVRCFNNQQYSLIEWRSDKALPDWGTPRSSQWPDLVFEENTRPNRRFAIECKYRSRTNGGLVKWSYPEQFACYREYEKRERIPVYLALGLGGEPDNPKNIFMIRLRRIEEPVIDLRDFERCCIISNVFEIDLEKD